MTHLEDIMRIYNEAGIAYDTVFEDPNTVVAIENDGRDKVGGHNNFATELLFGEEGELLFQNIWG